MTFLCLYDTIIKIVFVLKHSNTDEFDYLCELKLIHYIDLHYEIHNKAILTLYFYHIH